MYITVKQAFLLVLQLIKLVIVEYSTLGSVQHLGGEAQPLKIQHKTQISRNPIHIYLSSIIACTRTVCCSKDFDTKQTLQRPPTPRSHYPHTHTQHLITRASIAVGTSEVMGVRCTIRLCAEIPGTLRQRHQPAVSTAV